MELNYGTPFSYFFRSPGWPKQLLVASLLTCTLVGAAPVLGWTIEITRRVAKNEPQPVPELRDWRHFWKLGGQFAFVNAVWLMPLLATVLVLYGVPALLVRLASDEAVLLGFGATLLCVVLFLLVYSTVYVFFVPVMMSVLALDGRAGAAVHPGRLWRVVRKRPGGYLMAFLIVGVALFNLGFLLAAASLFLLLPPVLVTLGLVTAHYAGQLAREDDNETNPAKKEDSAST